ncbi:hypothetical protein [Halopelagius longus]|uniref:Domain of unknown function domain-containing protein n=1 Tax=Halopelagius longus TaxID=1236180 RepID=A0A1H0YT95_9EURY|nr:hypothetical protein [Halopelagius longus]SDQ18404.1 hypothetical protein SAMN05216278_0831 [Halopelagius longus]
MSDRNERPRGILTPKDRALLRGEIKYEYTQQYSNRRKTIRERITNGILDFDTIQYLLGDDDRKRIFLDPSREANVEDAQFHEAVRALLYWTYFGLKEQNYDFEGLLTEAIEEAEEEFAQKYWGEHVDVSVRFDVDIARIHSTENLIAAVEQGGPVKANRLYDLLTLSGGVPIDTSKLDTVRVWFQSSYPKGEKAVLETLFSQYLDTEVEIKDAVARITSEDLGIDKNSAVVDKGQSPSKPGEIKNYRSSTKPEVNMDALEEEIHQQAILDELPDLDSHTAEGDKSVLESAIDDIVEDADSFPPSIRDIIEDRKDSDDPNEEVSPERVLELLEQIRDPFASTVEIAAALGCAPDAARHALSSLLSSGQIKCHPVTEKSGDQVPIWWVEENSE